MADIKKLIDQTILIEGLLRNIEAHESDLHLDYLAQLSMKFEEFQEMYYDAFPPNQLFGNDLHESETEVAEIMEIEEDEPTPPAFQPQQFPQQQPYTPQPLTPQPRVDEALSRRKAEDLSKAFTINDKYRFGQSLYYGNTELMNEQIKSAQNFSNYQQAFDLFVYSNNWDPDSPLVKEFMAVVSRHFQQS